MCSKENSILFNSSVHGVDEIQNSKSKRGKVFWACVVAVCASLMIYQIGKIFTEYREKPCATYVKVNRALQLPNMTFCPKKWINYSEATRLGLNTTDINELLGFLRNVVLKQIYIRIYMMTTAENRITQAPHNYSSPKDVKEKLLAIAYTWNEMISCFPQYCYPVMGHERIITIDGICYMVGFSPSVNFARDYLGGSFFKNIGLKTETEVDLYIGHHAEDFMPWNPLTFASGHKYQVKVKKVEIVKQPTKEDPCYDEITERQQKLCFSTCLQNHMEICFNCNTVWIFLQNMQIPNPCTMQNYQDNTPPGPSQNDCIRRNAMDMSECVITCKVPCAHAVFESMVIQSGDVKVENDGFHAMFEFQPNSIFSYMQFTEVSLLNWHRVVSNVGGQMGLWLGLSLVSALQLLYHIVGSIVESIAKKMDNLVKIRLKDNQSNMQESGKVSHQRNSVTVQKSSLEHATNDLIVHF